MKRATKLWLLTAAALIVLGMLGAVCVMAVNHWDFAQLGRRYESETNEIGEAFESISIRTDTEDLLLMPAADGKCRAEFYDEGTKAHTAAVKDGTLTIETADTRKSPNSMKALLPSSTDMTPMWKKTAANRLMTLPIMWKTKKHWNVWRKPRASQTMTKP